jgi:hypothetical protein
MVTNGDTLGAKTRKNTLNTYRCEKCDYTTSKTSDWKRHLQTKKHNGDIMMTNGDTLGAKTRQNKPSKWQCVCGKHYLYRQGYHRHKKTCTYVTSNASDEPQIQIVTEGIDKDEIIIELLKKMTEQNKVIGDLVHRAGNHNNVNSNSFNTNIILQLNSKYPHAQPVQYLIDQIKNSPKCITHDPKMYAQALVEALTNQHDDQKTIRSVKDTMYVKYEETFKEDKEGEVFDTIKKETEQDQLSKASDQNKNMFQREKEAKKYPEMVSGIMKPLTSKDKKRIKNKII